MVARPVIKFVFCLFCGLCVGSPFVAAEGITAEMVLGDYKADPLFGEAAADSVINVQITERQFIPDNMTVQAKQTTRLVFTNDSLLPHLIIFTDNLTHTMSHGDIEAAVREPKSTSSVGGHTHSSNTSGDGAASMVRLVSEMPSVYVRAGDTREILVNFDLTGSTLMTCVMENHVRGHLLGTIHIEVNAN